MLRRIDRSPRKTTNAHDLCNQFDNAKSIMAIALTKKKKKLRMMLRTRQKGIERVLSTRNQLDFMLNLD